MADVNKVILIGRTTRDPQLKILPSQTALCEFGLAVGHKWKDASGEKREETTFVDCVLFGKGAEIFNQYVAKGHQVYVEGRLKLDSWEDKNGGGKRSKLSVVVDQFQFLEGRRQDDQPGAGHGQESQTRPPAARTMNRQAAQPEQEVPAFDDADIPF